MTATAQNRQPKGVPVGGQFAATSNPESTLILDEVAGELEAVYETAQVWLDTLGGAPDDEPVLEFIATRKDAEQLAERPLSVEEWQSLVKAFEKQAGSKYGAFNEMDGSFIGVTEFLLDPSEDDEPVEEVESPYAAGEHRTTKAVREKLSEVDPDEKVIVWMQTRSCLADDIEGGVTPSQWAKVCEKFAEYDVDNGSVAFMDETFAEALYEVIDTPTDAA